MLNIFWFRRDLRLDDNRALNEALKSGLPVLPVFIFDTNITGELPSDDARISFIYERLSLINDSLNKKGSSIYILKGSPDKIWEELVASLEINAVYVNKDYEPYAIQRDNAIEQFLKKSRISFFRIKDQVIFEEGEILKPDNKPYTVFTPYKNRWLKKLSDSLTGALKDKSEDLKNFYSCSYPLPSMEDIGFRESSIGVKPYDLSAIPDYHKYRDIPSADKTSYLSPHLRFGTVSIRKIAKKALDENLIFLNELIWREFFMQILYHFPNVVTGNFKPVYDFIQWRNDEKEFLKWCNGETGYPIVDAGMRQLNGTGYMHNRLRMITAGFLCKHLLIDWRWGEAHFARFLLDYEMASNNGNWQWAAGTGCDSAPYFRIFNPMSQAEKFDSKNIYIKKWVPEFESILYIKPIIDHSFARSRCLETYKSALETSFNNI